MRKHLPLLVLVGIVVLLGGYLIFNTFTQKEKPSAPGNIKTPAAENRNLPAAPGPQPPGQEQSQAPDKQAEKSVVPDMNPSQGEVFIYGKVQDVDVEKRIVIIDQHMDDNSVKIKPNVPVKKDAIIQNKKQDIGLAQIKPGDSVGIILTKDGHARAVLVD
ncbi:MAG: hypothetical protein ACOY4Q_04400 [Bacillota bacterium]